MSSGGDGNSAKDVSANTANKRFLRSLTAEERTDYDALPRGDGRASKIRNFKEAIEKKRRSKTKVKETHVEQQRKTASWDEDFLNLPNLMLSYGSAVSMQWAAQRCVNHIAW